MDVGVRELKNHLSRYLTQVAQGSEIIVTDRGRAVARLTAVGTQSTIERLIAEGIVTPGASPKRLAPTVRVRAKEPVSPLVVEQRH